MDGHAAAYLQHKSQDFQLGWSYWTGATAEIKLYNIPFLSFSKIATDRHSLGTRSNLGTIKNCYPSASSAGKVEQNSGSRSLQPSFPQLCGHWFARWLAAGWGWARGEKDGTLGHDMTPHCGTVVIKKVEPRAPMAHLSSFKVVPQFVS